MKTIMMRTLRVLAAAVVLFFIVPINVSAAEISQLSIKANGDGTVSIVDCQTSAEGELVIPEKIGGRTVTTIAGEAFSQCRNITKVTLPGTITSIGSGAFWNCVNLEEINFPDSITTIGNEAFDNCISLKAVQLPDSVTTLGWEVFSGCTNLSSANIPKQLEKVPDEIFSHCENLRSIVIPSNIQSIGFRSFWKSGLVSITIPSSVKTLESFCFTDCEDLAFITLNEGLQSIGTDAFRNCTSLKLAVIPDSVEHLADGGFARCTSLETLVIGKGIKSFADYLGHFRGCSNLRKVILFSECSRIGHESFENCPAITDVYYGGTEQEWLNLSVGTKNDSILLANVHYIKSFKDVKTASWYGYPVYWAVAKEVTSGMGEGTFRPMAPLSRAQAVTFLYNLAGKPDVSALQTKEFADVPSTAWFNDAIKWAVANKITSGYGTGTFQPNTTCTRAMIVTFLANYAKAAGIYRKPTISSTFTDVAEDAWYKASVDWAVENGITSGYGAGTFSPNVTCNRAMMVTFLQKVDALTA